MLLACGTCDSPTINNKKTVEELSSRRSNRPQYSNSNLVYLFLFTRRAEQIQQDIKKMKQSGSNSPKWRNVLTLVTYIAFSRRWNTEALQLHTTLTFAGLKAQRQAARISRVPSWLLPQTVLPPPPRARKLTNLAGSESHLDEPEGQNDEDFPMEFLAELKENNLSDGKRKRDQLKSSWDSYTNEVRPNSRMENPMDSANPEDDNEWFDVARNEIKDKYEGIRKKVRKELADSRQADPDNMPDTAEGMVDTVLRQEMETVIRETRSEMELDRYRQLELDELSAVENLDLKSLEEDKKVARLVQESKDEFDRQSRSQAEIDDFMNYQKERLRSAVEGGEDDSNIVAPTGDLDSWALDRMEDMLSNNAGNSVLEASVTDLRSRIRRAKNDNSFKPDSYQDWQMYRSISQDMKNRTNGVAANADDVLDQLKSWKAYLAMEQAYRQQVGLTPKQKMPFDWSQANLQQPSAAQLISAEEEKRNPDTYRAEINREAVKAMESLLQKRRGAPGSEEFAKRIESLKATLESTNYVDRVLTKERKVTSGPVDVSDVFGVIGTLKTAPKKKKRTMEEFSKFPGPEKKEKSNKGAGVKDNVQRQPEDADGFVDDYEPIVPTTYVEPPLPSPERPKSMFFDSPDSDDVAVDKKSSVPKTPFFEEVDRSDEKLGTLDEQKLRNMYRKAGARSEEEQDRIRTGWEEFQAYEASKRDLSGFSDKNMSDNSTASADLGYNISDVLKEDGDIDAEKIIAAIRARRPKPSLASGNNANTSTIQEPESLAASLDAITSNEMSPLQPVENSKEDLRQIISTNSETDSLPLAISLVSDQEIDEPECSSQEKEIRGEAELDEQDRLPDVLNYDQAIKEPKLERKGKFTSENFKRPPQFESLFEQSEGADENSRDEKLTNEDSVDSTSFKNSVDGDEKPSHLKPVVDKGRVESAKLSFEDFGLPTRPLVLEQSPNSNNKVEVNEAGTRFAKKSFVKRQEKEYLKPDDLVELPPTHAPNGKALGGFLGDEAFDDIPVPRKANPDDMARRKEEFERLRALQEKRRAGLDLTDVIGSRTRGEDFKKNSMEDYFFPIRNSDADLSSFRARKSTLLERPLLNVVDVNNLMDLKDSLEGDGLSRYIPPISKPFREFGVIFRLEGVLVDITGLQNMAWTRVAEMHNFESPLVEDVRLATVVKPEFAVQRIFYWSNDMEVCREVAESHSKVIKDLVIDMLRNDKNMIGHSSTSSTSMSKSAQSIGDEMLTRSGENEKSTLTVNALQKVHHQAWREVAVERGFKPPSFDDAVAAMAINDPAYIIREWFKWSTDMYVIQEISQSYREMVLKIVGEKTGVKIDSTQKRKGRGFLPAMVDPSLWREQNQGSVDEIEARARKELLIKLAKDAWFILARTHGFPKPQKGLISQALRVGPDEAVMTVFGWAKNAREKLDLVRSYYEIFNGKLDRSKLRQGSSVSSKAPDAELTPVQVIDGAVKWVSSLVNVEMSCGIVSFLERDVVDMILKQTGFSHLISSDKIITASDIYSRDDQQLLGAAIRLERKPDHCILIDSTPEMCVTAREMEMKSVAMPGIYRLFELVAADTTARDFDTLTPTSIRRLFAERENQEPLLLSEVVRPIKRRKVKTRFVDENDREWDSDEYFDEYGNYGESTDSEDRKNYDKLEDTFENAKSPDDEGGVAFDDEFKGWLFQ